MAKRLDFRWPDRSLGAPLVDSQSTLNIGWMWDGSYQWVKWVVRPGVPTWQVWKAGMLKFRP